MNSKAMWFDTDATYIVTNIIKKKATEESSQTNVKLGNITKRSNRPLIATDKDSEDNVFFQETIGAKIENTKIIFSRPNEIALSMSIASKSLERASEIRKDILKNIDSGKQTDFYDARVNDIYDYLEEVQKTVVFGYKAIEALCNSAIPHDYVYKKELNKKGIHEIYDKHAIERWVTTSEKISKILPEIYKCASPTTQKFWGHFKKMEDLRNDIIHSKSNTTSKLLSELLSNDIGKYFKSCESLLLYYYKQDRENALFPMLPNVSMLPVVNFKDMEEAFKIIR